MRELTRYLLSQAVSWLTVAGVTALLVHVAGLPAWIWAGVVLMIANDLLLIPAMRRAWGPARAGPETLIGARGKAVERLAPTGYVRVRGELWEARLRDPGATIAKGRPVVVRQVHGLTVVVDETDHSG
jgi:membrane protein implicated in regulation of membrane protease activity